VSVGPSVSPAMLTTLACHFPSGHIWTWTSLARSVLDCLTLSALKLTPVSPVSSAAHQRHRPTGTGHPRMQHASLSAVGDVTTELLREDLSALASSSLRLVLDFWMLEPHHPGPPSFRCRLRKKKIRTPCGFEEDTHPTAHVSFRACKALAEHSRCPCPSTSPCLQDPGRALTVPHHQHPSSSHVCAMVKPWLSLHNDLDAQLPCLQSPG
jgi:hypothetical protein